MDKALWKPSKKRIEATNMFRYMKFVNQRFDKSFENYDELYSWSINNISDLWSSLWDFVDIKHSKKYDQVIDDDKKMPGAKWFSGAKLNFAENLLRYRDNQIAIISCREDGLTIKLTYADLYTNVARISKAMQDAGVVKGDRVAGFMPNIPEAVAAMLAAASIGAMWSSCSPDFGIKGVLDRFGQIKPKLLFTANGYFYNGKEFNSIEKVLGIFGDVPSIEKVVVVPYTNDNPDTGGIKNAVLFQDFIAKEKSGEIQFAELPFDHPLYIMYSSGTTGLPKCMVQSAGGILINHLKELVLHTDLKREDNIFYFTTCGWMMWNWLVSSLAVGATITLFDGSPFYPNPGALFKIAQDQKISIFGTSAKYLAAVEAEGLKPAKEYKLDALKAVLSTGSPLSAESFDFVYRDIKKDISLASISGGTDLNGCFALGNPMGPVYTEELQCRGLGMRVEAWDDNGNSIFGKEGELVCTRPFPSMPIYFWDDPDGKKYHNAYFDTYPDIWRHGDFIVITKRGGVIMRGRSDATLNPGGVRIGTAEIYRQVEMLGEVEDSLVIGQNWKDDVRVILFVKLSQGVNLTEELKTRIKKTIRKNTSPRHVPAKIIQIADIPYTINMKKVEIAVKKVIEGSTVKNRDALRNPEALDLYNDIKELRED